MFQGERSFFAGSCGIMNRALRMMDLFYATVGESRNGDPDCEEDTTLTVQEEKKALRKELREVEKALPDAYRAEAGSVICARLLALPEYRSAGTVFCFVGAGREIDTRPFLEGALRDAKRLCVPLCVSMGVMELRQIDAMDRLVPGAYGIPEPVKGSPLVEVDEVDFAVIPCLSCSRSGLRLGKGGGFYDRFLAAYRGSAVLVCPERLVREDIPMEPHDRPVPRVLTEAGLYERGQRTDV